jgi:hypothetical protein
MTNFPTSMSNPGKTIHLSKLSKDLAEQIEPLSSGAMVLILNLPLDNEQEITDFPDDHQRLLEFVMWKCWSDIMDSLVAKVDIHRMLSKKLDALEAVVA